ncbi:MAG: hypothetical protein P4L22_07865 [Candidatus Babeliales bacterium]|nr:hypothetical protein [Candidatus Babeliales bacterium]
MNFIILNIRTNEIIKFILLNITIVSFAYGEIKVADKAPVVVAAQPVKAPANTPAAASPVTAKPAPTNIVSAAPTQKSAVQPVPAPAKPITTEKAANTTKTMPVAPGAVAPAKPENVPAPKCDNNQASHNNICAYCPSDSNYNKDTNKCVCNNPNEIIGRGTTSADNKTYFQCVTCPANLVPNKDKTECVCKDHETPKGRLQCNKYSTNEIQHNRKDGTYKCNETAHVLGYDTKKDLLKCYSCPADAKYDKDNNVCVCTKPDAKNSANKIEYAPVVVDDKLVCNPNSAK